MGMGNLEDEVGRKPRLVAFDLLIEPLGGDAVEAGEIGIDHGLVTADDEDAASDVRRGNERGRLVLLGDGDSPSQAGC